MSPCVDHVNHFLGLRFDDWTSLVVFARVVVFLLRRRYLMTEDVDLGVPPDSRAQL